MVERTVNLPRPQLEGSPWNLGFSRFHEKNNLPLYHHIVAIATLMKTRGMSTSISKPFQALKNNTFFASHKLFAVVGASADRAKFGNKVLRCYQKRGFPVVPVNQRAPSIEGLGTAASLTALSTSLPEELQHGGMQHVGVSIITPPAVTSSVLREGYALGCRSFFLQPGTYNTEVESTLEELADATFIKSCVLVDLDCHDDF